MRIAKAIHRTNAKAYINTINRQTETNFYLLISHQQELVNAKTWSNFIAIF